MHKGDLIFREVQQQFSAFLLINSKEWKRPRVDAPHAYGIVFFAILTLFDVMTSYVKPFGRESAKELTERRTDGNTERPKHGTDSITSTADAGGKNELP